MRSGVPTRVGAVVTVVAATLLAACSGPPGPGPSTSPVTSTSVEPPGTSTDDPTLRRPSTDPTAVDADLSDVVGPQLRLRSSGSFGENEMSFRRGQGLPFPIYVEVDYPAHSASQRAAESGGAGSGGAQSYWLLEEPLDAAYLRYWVRFQDGFNWVKGGKLPGLFGGTTTSGRNIPDGTDGFSTRYMWRAGGTGEVYAYLPTSEEHGTSLGRGDWTWPSGRWVCVEQHVVLNTPGQADGRVSVWLDGKSVSISTNLTFRSTPNLRVDGLFFSTFFGGGDESWATPIDQTAQFGGFVISPRRIGCGRNTT